MTIKMSKEEQRVFESGAKRNNDANKPRPDLISPWFLNRLGTLLAEGAKHYGENNWCLGIPSSQYFASLCRHMTAYASGKTDEDHLAAMAFNIMGLIHNEELNKNKKFLVRHNQEMKNIGVVVDFPYFSPATGEKDDD